MQVKMGCTRLVLLTETVAIKIALPLSGVLIMLQMVMLAIISGELFAKLKKYKGNVTRIVMRLSTIGGIASNRREMRISREYPEYPIARVLGSYFWGLVIVMERAKPIGDSPNAWEAHFSLPEQLRYSDLFFPRNMGRIRGRLVIVDYGDPDADEILGLCFGLCD